MSAFGTQAPYQSPTEGRVASPEEQSVQGALTALQVFPNDKFALAAVDSGKKLLATMVMFKASSSEPNPAQRAADFQAVADNASAIQAVTTKLITDAQLLPSEFRKEGSQPYGAAVVIHEVSYQFMVQAKKAAAEAKAEVPAAIPTPTPNVPVITAAGLPSGIPKWAMWGGLALGAWYFWKKR